MLDLLQQTAHVDEDLLVYCDSPYVINSVTKWLAGLEATGLDARVTASPSSTWRSCRPSTLPSPGGGSEFAWVKGHSGHPLNEAADGLANGGRDGVEGRRPSGRRSGLLRRHRRPPGRATGSGRVRGHALLKRRLPTRHGPIERHGRRRRAAT